MSLPRPARCRTPALPPPPEAGQHGGILLKLLALLLLLALAGAVYLLRRPLLRAAGEWFIVDELPQPYDAIVVLGDDNYPADRATRAAELYKERWAPRVIASGHYLRPYASVADLERRDLMERGVPAEAIVPFANFAANTREEAYAVRGLLRQKGWRRVLVVTSNYHTRRARYIYRRVLDPGMEGRVMAARDSGFDPGAWWESRFGLKVFFRECAAMLVTFVEMRRKPPADLGPLVGKPASARP
jgi:vancomycin permeability regulator SanA